MPAHSRAIRRCPGIGDNTCVRALEVIMALTKSLTKNGDGRIRVLVADSTPLTGRLIADVLKRDRRFAITDASGNSVLPTAAALEPDVAIISETLEGVA